MMNNETTKETLAEQKKATKNQLSIMKWMKDANVWTGSWAGYKRLVMEREGVDHQLFHTWDVPLDYMYAQCRSRVGYTHRSTVMQLTGRILKR